MKNGTLTSLVALAICLVLTTGTANAISRYNSTSLSCSKAKQLVSSQGAVIFRYPAKSNPSLTRYNRFVAHGGLCAFGETAVLGTVPTTDTKSCSLLYCAQRGDDRGFGRRKGGGNGNGPTFYGRYFN